MIQFQFVDTLQAMTLLKFGQSRHIPPDTKRTTEILRIKSENEQREIAEEVERQRQFEQVCIIVILCLLVVRRKFQSDQRSRKM